MSEEPDVREILDVLKRHVAAARPEAATETAARAWMEAGFADAEEIAEWLSSGCTTPQEAEALERAGITPAQAALRTTAGSVGYEETIGYKLNRGDLSFDEARRIITTQFWNS